ncbi:MAG: lipooligosaccharide transport system ATP-binding protein [Frankiaceae bacterium]|jgi:lipooligosaccharide transport system ATP-binding protein|nr:lipooligosaccharide transport system ATP-binding protein [Frankiaceae bacterium]
MQGDTASQAATLGVAGERPSTGPLVEARKLTKVHPARGGAAALVAVDGIDFRLERGEAFGFLGPNGAGKSSTMRMIACVSPPTSGTLRMLGMDAATDGSAIRARIGVVPQDDSLDAALTVRENLLVYGRYFGLSRATVRERSDKLLDFARLEDKADQRVETLSGGMRRRLTIARSLINDPELLLLDEPTTGLDPQARHVLWERLFQLKSQGVTLILTTHYMDEAEQLCDRLVIMDGGRIVAEGSPRALIDAHVTREVLELRFADADREKATDVVLALAPGPVCQRVDVLPDRLLVYADDGDDALAVVNAAGLEPLTALVRRASLEDVFLTLTGRSLVE